MPSASNRLRKPETLGIYKLFLLLSIKFGFSTSYDFLSRLQMSVNSSGPRLREMEKEGLVTATPGPRNTMRYSLTEAGHDALKASLELYQSRHWDFERELNFENLPLALLSAWFYSGAESALECLNEAQEQIRSRAKKKRSGVEEVRASMAQLRSDIEEKKYPVEGATLLSTSFALIRAELAAGQLEFQADSLSALKPLIKKLPPQPKVRRDAKRLW